MNAQNLVMLRQSWLWYDAMENNRIRNPTLMYINAENTISATSIFWYALTLKNNYVYTKSCVALGILLLGKIDVHLEVVDWMNGDGDEERGERGEYVAPESPCQNVFSCNCDSRIFHILPHTSRSLPSGPTATIQLSKVWTEKKSLVPRPLSS